MQMETLRFSSLARFSMRNALTKRLFDFIKYPYRERTLGTSAVQQSSHEIDKKLFTPGPLGTSITVKKAMLKDLGSRDVEFTDTVKFLRSRILDVAGASPSQFACVPMQGSGTFAIESVFQSTVPKTGAKALILENGAYGKRAAKICNLLGIPCHVESFPENERVDLGKVETLVKGDNSFSIVSIVHCETSSGVINPVEQVGQVLKQHIPGSDYFVDAMSSFGAIPLDLAKGGIDYMVSSVNKCLEGIPGFSYVIAKKDKLLQCKGFSRSLSLDLYDQYEALEKTGQFRFTPPTHTMLAFRQALEELDKEGGVLGRAKRYKENHQILKAGMRRLGFQEFLDSSHDGYIITSYCFPNDPNFNFPAFYNRLHEKGQVIYPGKVLDADCFRIGNIGHVFPEDMYVLLQAIEEVCSEMNLNLLNQN